MQCGSEELERRSSAFGLTCLCTCAAAMGCVSSKNGGSVNPAADWSSGAHRGRRPSSRAPEPERSARPLHVSASSLRTSSAAAAAAAKLQERKDEAVVEHGKAVGSLAVASRSFRLRSLRMSLEGEQVAAGWPSWLSAVAGEAIQGWIPLKADDFQKLEQVPCCFRFSSSGPPATGFN